MTTRQITHDANVRQMAMFVGIVSAIADKHFARRQPVEDAEKLAPVTFSR
jgi:hypothetical protein